MLSFDIVGRENSQENSLDHIEACQESDIPTRVIKENAHILSEALHLLFNVSVNEGAFPSVFKLADVSPVFFPQFPSSKNSEDNYRSISNLNDLSKVVESIIYKQTATLIGKYFSKFRCGFRKGYSTQQRLIAIIEKWKSAVDSGKSFRALLRDLSKAFDCLPCKLLLAKLNAYDLSLSALRLICSYLFNRQRRTKINASYSSW